MPRQPRIYLENTVYYITSRGDHNQEIFREEGDYKMFLDLLKKYKEQYGFKLFAYVLVPNHFHLLLELLSQKKDEYKGGVSEIMHDLNSSYTKYFNARYHRKGHLFRERFKTALVEKETYLAKLTVYAHLNPQKIDLVTDAKSYPYSSYLYYLDKEIPFEDLMKNEKDEVLGLLGNQTYEDFVNRIGKELDLNLHNALHKKGMLGSEDFEGRIRNAISGFKKEEQEEKVKKLSVGLKSGIVLFTVVLVGAGLTIFLQMLLKEKSKKQKPQLTAQKSLMKTERNPLRGVITSTETLELDKTEWQIKLVSNSDNSEIIDSINFRSNKFSSARLNSSGYASSNYSIAIEDNGKITFETMQTSSEGSAFWHGEIENGKMNGALSLRKAGEEPQDFSFSSMKYLRRK